MRTPLAGEDRVGASAPARSYLRSIAKALAVGLIAVFGRVMAAEVERITFATEVQNLRLADLPLELGLTGVTLQCADASGDMRFGQLPHRLRGEDFDSKKHFVAFAAVYPPDGKPSLFVDFSGDRRLTCDERLVPVAHPDGSDRYFRTVKLQWRDDGPPRKRMYRITVPGSVAGGKAAFDAVDVQIARRNVGGHQSLWVLLDGNYDGMFDRRYGDAVLIDALGTKSIDSTPEGSNLHSFHAPIVLPWGTFEASEIDPLGGFLTLKPLPASAAASAKVLGIGDAVPPMTCKAQDGSKAVIGGTREGTQIVFFWLSYCGSCRSAMDSLTPLIHELSSQGVTAVGVSLDEKESAYREFLQEHVVTWPQCFSGKMLTDNPLARRFGVHDPSEVIIIARDGRFVSRVSKVSMLQDELVRLGLLHPAISGSAPRPH